MDPVELRDGIAALQGRLLAATENRVAMPIIAELRELVSDLSLPRTTPTLTADLRTVVPLTEQVIFAAARGLTGMQVPTDFPAIDPTVTKLHALLIRIIEQLDTLADAPPSTTVQRPPDRIH